MASFAVVDRALSSAVSDLHDYLWAGKRLEEKALLRPVIALESRLAPPLGPR